MKPYSLRPLHRAVGPMLPSFDEAPADPRAGRIKAIEDYWQQYPGAAPNGSGPTGLASSDAKGWSDLLNQQTEYFDLIGQPKEVRLGHDLGSTEHYAGLPAGYTEDRFVDEVDRFKHGGREPGFARSQNLPETEARFRRAMAAPSMAALVKRGR